MKEKICQVSGKVFTMRPEDEVFYEKINVPLPTFSPEERLRRRMQWRNERSLYKRVCEKTGESVISCFSPDSGVKIFNRDYWWSDAWNPFAYGREYDFSKPFFQQFKELLESIPMPSLFTTRNVNSPYSNHAGESKDMYMCFGMWDVENLMYSAKTVSAKDSIDVYWGNHSELSYELVNSQHCYKSQYLVDCSSVSGSNFLFDCHNCQSCFMSSNLRNKQYVFRNKQLSKEDYLQEITNIKIGSRVFIEKLKKEFKEMREMSVHKYAHIIQTHNSTGDYLEQANNCHECFDIESAEECAYVVSAGLGTKDCLDLYGAGVQAELMYESVDCGDHASYFLGNIFCWGGYNVSYSYAVHNAQNVFGCIGTHKADYVILNKQYTKEKYEELLPKIKQHMMDMPYIDSKGREYRYGEFFPSELSPFAYNETIAQEYFPLTKEQVLQQGLTWKDKEKKEYAITLNNQDIPDTIAEVTDDILDQIIECEDKEEVYSPGVFRITAQELAFYRGMNIPLPRKSPDARHYDRLKMRNPMKLWKRTTEDGVEVMTSYAPDRPEKIYSEKGYQKI